MLRPGPAGRARPGPKAVLGAALALALSSPLWLGATGSAAGTPVGPCENASVCVGVSTPPRPPGGGGGGGSGGGGGGISVCSYHGNDVPCSNEYGTFDSADGCYYALMQPQPPAGDPYWEGNAPGNGAVYYKTCPFGGNGGTSPSWLPTPPASGATTVTPGEVAQMALDKIQLMRATVHTAPSALDRRTALVGSPIWLWIDRRYRNEWATAADPLTAEAAVLGLRVVAKVWATSVVWDMGDGGRATCTLPGTKYQPSDGGATSPDCSYTYKRPSANQPGQEYAITAAVHWTVSWKASGLSTAADAFDLDPVAAPATVLTVAELQVLN